jgi:hypothetical protein
MMMMTCWSINMIVMMIVDHDDQLIIDHDRWHVIKLMNMINNLISCSSNIDHDIDRSIELDDDIVNMIEHVDDVDQVLIERSWSWSSNIKVDQELDQVWSTFGVTFLRSLSNIGFSLKVKKKGHFFDQKLINFWGHFCQISGFPRKWKKCHFFGSTLITKKRHFFRLFVKTTKTRKVTFFRVPWKSKKSDFFWESQTPFWTEACFFA